MSCLWFFFLLLTSTNPQFPTPRWLGGNFSLLFIIVFFKYMPFIAFHCTSSSPSIGIYYPWIWGKNPPNSVPPPYPAIYIKNSYCHGVLMLWICFTRESRMCSPKVLIRISRIRALIERFVSLHLWEMWRVQISKRRELVEKYRFHPHCFNIKSDVTLGERKRP